MQNTNRWRSDRLDGAVVGHFLEIPWSNESDANVEDSDCIVRMLLFISITTEAHQKKVFSPKKYHIQKS